MPGRTGEASVLRSQLVVDGSGRARVSTGVDVLDHVLVLLAGAGGFDLELTIDPNALDEERVAAAGLAVGTALADALGEPRARGVGDAAAPADEALAHVTVESSGRPLVVSNVDLSAEHVGELRGDLLARLLETLAGAARLTVHVRLLHGEETGHVLDAIAKALGLALAQACATRR